MAKKPKSLKRFGAGDPNYVKDMVERGKKLGKTTKLPNPNGPNNSLDFAVNFKPIVWNFIAGVYAPVTDHFDISIQSGWGQRRSLTAVIGYRF